MSDGRPISVRTPTTYRAQQLILIYNSLKDNKLSNKNRLNLLIILYKI